MESIIYGTDPLACETHRILSDHSVLDVIGFIDDRPIQLDSEFCGLRIVGQSKDLATVTQERFHHKETIVMDLAT